eukprot:1156043-Pelagomonas_calceolata.AAC.2
MAAFTFRSPRHHSAGPHPHAAGLWKRIRKEREETAPKVAYARTCLSYTCSGVHHGQPNVQMTCASHRDQGRERHKGCCEVGASPGGASYNCQDCMPVLFRIIQHGPPGPCIVEGIWPVMPQCSIQACNSLDFDNCECGRTCNPDKNISCAKPAL